MLRLDGVSVAIGPVGILRSVTMEVGAGQFAGLIGRNGAGKTTLLRTVMGLLPLREGTLALEGVPQLARLAVHGRVKAGIGYMPEDRRLVPGLSAEENVLVPAWSMRAPDWAERLAEIYRAIPEVEAFRDRRALQLSGGQQKLVALARAMMAGRRLLLLDEPFEGVAPVLARRLAEVIAGLRRTGLTVVLSESSLDPRPRPARPRLRHRPRRGHGAGLIVTARGGRRGSASACCPASQHPVFGPAANCQLAAAYQDFSGGGSAGGAAGAVRAPQLLCCASVTRYCCRLSRDWRPPGRTLHANPCRTNMCSG